MTTQEVGLDNHPKVCIELTSKEYEVVKTWREEVRYGQFTIEVQDGCPWRILTGVKSRKL